jgi:hypothetical protein
VTAKFLVLLSAGITFLLGGIHLYYTFTGTSLLPRDAALHSAMSQAHLSITKETTVWRAWVGFNASHSMALILFGLVYGYLALYQPKLLFGSAYLQVVGLAMLAGLAVLAKLYWFSVPLAGALVALVAFSAGVAMAARA